MTFPMSPEDERRLRSDVRAFLAGEIVSGAWSPHCDSWLAGFDPDFSRRLGARGWIGMTFPRRYGGAGRDALSRFVVTEELLAAGAPVAAHWFADRQVGPALLRYGTEDQRRRHLPAIARGERFFAIGMSEPEAGSDLAAVRTRAERRAGGWRLNGTKLWASGAHRAHFAVVLARTAPMDADARHAGLSQFIVALDRPGVAVNPIRLLNGEHHFNELALEDVDVADADVLGRVGDGWRQVTGELAWERSGPERFMSTVPLLTAALDEVAAGDGHEERIGRLVAELWSLRQMSLGVARLLATGATPDVDAAIVKALGTTFERRLIDGVRDVLAIEADPGSTRRVPRLLAQAVQHSPGFTLRGGTSEILRGLIARSVAAS